MLVLASGAGVLAGLITLNSRILTPASVAFAFFIGVHLIVRAIERQRAKDSG